MKHGTFDGLKGTADDGSFAIKLPGKGITLQAGTYWVSVGADCSFEGGCGEWGWETSSVVHGYMAMWRSCEAGSCTNWETLGQCCSSSGDFMFDLRGVARRKEE